MNEHQVTTNQPLSGTFGKNNSSNKPKRAKLSRVETTSVSVLMTRQVLTISPEMDLETLTQLFLDHGISGAPVVDAARMPIGIVSKTDLIRDRYEHGSSTEMDAVSDPRSPSDPDIGENGFHLEPLAGRAMDIMTPISYSVTESTSIAQAAALMAFENIHRVPVVDDGGQVVGLISSLDVLRWIAEEQGYLRHRTDPAVSEGLGGGVL